MIDGYISQVYYKNQISVCYPVHNMISDIVWGNKYQIATLFDESFQEDQTICCCCAVDGAIPDVGDGKSH